MFNKCPGLWQWQSKKGVENIKKEEKNKKIGPPDSKVPVLLGGAVD